MKIKIKTPAKINLSLKVEHVCENGFHPINSIMQSVSLFDYLTIELLENSNNISISGNSTNIPYDEKNIAYRAAKLYFETLNKNFGAKIYIEKNIPISAGLAGGSTNAAGVIYGLNKILSEPFSIEILHQMCAKLGSDLNFCLVGGKCRCLGRGEIVQQMEFENLNLTLIKPKNLGISAKEAYQKFDELKMPSNLQNDLEFALLPHYSQLSTLHNMGFQMSGSGPTFFILKEKLPDGLIKNKNDYEIFEGLKALPYGVLEV